MSILKYTTKYVILGVLALIVCLGIITLVYSLFDKDNENEVTRSDEVLPVESDTHSEVPQTHSSHSRAWTEVPKSPPDDEFFKTIQFPDPPPQQVDGHPQRSKSPSPVPDFVHNNPDHFIVDEKGHFDIIYPKEKSKKLEDWSASGDMETDMAKQVEIITEGLDALPAAVVLMQYGGIHREAAKAHFEKALVENPDDFYALLYWAGLIKADNPAEAESIYRRLVKMRPDSFPALYDMGRHIVRTYSDPSEAIPYLEKAYHLAPHYVGSLLHLGRAYTRNDRSHQDNSKSRLCLT